VLVAIMFAVAEAGASAGTYLVPPMAVLLAIGAGRLMVRRRPDEQWIISWLVAGVVVKLAASYFRYLTLQNSYQGVGDAAGYHDFGVVWSEYFGGEGSKPYFEDLRRTNFVKYFTGLVYHVFGADLLVGFLVFGVLAFIGTCAWYRATADAVPSVNKRLYLALVLFAPSVAYWPSSLGKEALMQCGVGIFALGMSVLLRRRMLVGFAIGAAGGWLVWVVRPHLLALLMVAGAIAYFFGRSKPVDPWDDRQPSFIARPIGLVAVAVLMVVAIDQGAQFLGIEEFSISSIEAELDEQTERSSMGGSEFDNGGNSLNPIYLPQRAATVLLRPFPWETADSLQLLSSGESVLLACFIAYRLRSLRSSISQARERPFLLFCWGFTLLFVASFASFANFGLLVRQRSLVLPALFALLAVEPALVARARRQRAAGRHPSHLAAPPGLPPAMATTGAVGRPLGPVVTNGSNGSNGSHGANGSNGGGLTNGHR
jgi:hypothetical protein